MRALPTTTMGQGAGAPGTSGHGNVLTGVLLFQARGVRAVGGAAARHADALLAGPAQQRREGSPHHAGWVPPPTGQPGTPPPTSPREAGKPSAQAVCVLQPRFWDTDSGASTWGLVSLLVQWTGLHSRVTSSHSLLLFLGTSSPIQASSGPDSTTRSLELLMEHLALKLTCRLLRKRLLALQAPFSA